MSDSHLAEEWRADIPSLINDAVGPVPDTAPRLPSAEAATRVGSRAAKISIWLKRPEVVDKIHASTGFKLLDIIATVRAVIEIIITLLK
jgi:hypothetical protein